MPQQLLRTVPPKKPDPDIRRLLKKARKSEARRQHLVPKFYLKGWADERELIRVTDKAFGRDYLKKPEKVARITDFYTLDSSSTPKELPPLLAETIYAEVESQAAPIVGGLLSGSLSELSQAEIVAITLFLGFQMTRGRTTREQHNESATNLYKLQFGGLSDDELRRYLIADGEPLNGDDLKRARQAIDSLMAGDVVVGPEKAGSISLAMQSATEAGALLMLRAWIVATSPTPIITSDEPVVLLGSSDRPRSQRSGVVDADFIVFPLGKHRILVMLHPMLALNSGLKPVYKGGLIHEDHLDLVEAFQLSREVAMNCHRWLFESPTTQIGKNLSIPETAPRMETEWINVIDQMGETADVQRSYGITRWAEVPRGMWPQGRFWPLSYPPAYPPIRRYGYRGSFKDEFQRWQS